jgi:hypothetical protein
MKNPMDALFRTFLVWSGLLLLATASGHLHSPDGELNYRTAQSLARGQGFAIPPYPGGFGSRTGLDGKEYAQYGPLQPLLAAPFLLVGGALSGLLPEAWFSHQAERLNRTVGFYRPTPNDPDGFEGLYPNNHRERVTRAAVSLFNPVVTWISVWVLALWGRRLFGDSLAAFSLPFTYLIATMAWPQSRPFFHSEPLAVLFLLLAAFIADGMRGKDLSKGLVLRSILVGAAAGLAVLARNDSAVACPGIACLALCRLLEKRKGCSGKTLVGAGCAGVAACVCVASFQLLLNQIHFGSPISSGYSDQSEGIKFNIPLLQAAWIYLLSPGKGIFGYSPPLLAALAAWPIFFKRERTLAISLALIVLGYFLVVGRWQNLGGWCWGPRHLFQVTVFLMLPLPLLFGTEISPKLRRYANGLLMVTLVFGIFVQVCGVLVDFMWPLDQTLRGLKPGEDTARVLSLPYYGPLLHLWAWRLDPDPDWFLADLWLSGSLGARIVAMGLWGTLVAATGFLGRMIVQSRGRILGFAFQAQPDNNT